MMDKKENMGLNYNYQVAADSKNGTIVVQYLTQNSTDAHEIKIQMGINPHKVNFTYDWKTDSFICPMDEHLHYKNDIKLNGEWMRLCSTNKCKTCPVKDQCTKSRVREIFEPVNNLRWKMKADFISRRKNLL